MKQFYRTEKEHWDQNGVNLPKFIKNEYFIKHKAVIIMFQKH